MGEESISFREAKRRFGEMGVEKILRLIAAILKNPKLRGLGLEPDDNLKMAFRTPDIIRDLPIRPLIKSLSRIAGREYAPPLSGEDFGKLSALGEKIASEVPDTILRSLTSPDACSEPLILRRHDLASPVVATAHALHQFTELIRGLDTPSEGEIAPAKIRERFAGLFRQAEKKILPAGQSFHRLFPRRARAVDCLDNNLYGLRFLALKSHPALLFTVEAVTRPRVISWRDKRDEPGKIHRIHIVEKDILDFDWFWRYRLKNHI